MVILSLMGTLYTISNLMYMKQELNQFQIYISHLDLNYLH